MLLNKKTPEDRDFGLPGFSLAHIIHKRDYQQKAWLKKIFNAMGLLERGT
jgi:hypothetical protein